MNCHINICNEITTNHWEKKLLIQKKNSSFKMENIIGIPTFRTKKNDHYDISVWYAFCMDSD